MQNIRIGKDFTVEWPILTNGDAVPLAGRDLRLELHAPKKRVIEMPFETDGISIIVRMKPVYQDALGTHRFTLWENYGKDGQTVVDSCDAFQLVDSTHKESSSHCCNSNIEISYMKLTMGDMTFAPVTVGGDSIVVDDALSTTSTNPVQNRVITTEMNDIKEDVEDNAEDIEEAISKSAEASKKAEEAHSTASSASSRVDGLTEQVATLSEKVENAANGDIIWNDVE